VQRQDETVAGQNLPLIWHNSIYARPLIKRCARALGWKTTAEPKAHQF